MGSNILTYKGFICKIQFSEEDKCFYGKVEGLKRKDLILIEGNTVKEAKKDFKESMDEYLEFCKEVGINPNQVN